jgi:hypothetical protein
MRLLDRDHHPRRVTRIYGADTLLGLLSPLITMFMVSRGAWGPRDAAVLREMEKDAQTMADRGYRVASAERFELPLFGAAYEKVTYELVDPPT